VEDAEDAEKGQKVLKADGELRVTKSLADVQGTDHRWIRIGCI
jgi:hypothetical protein